MSSPDVNTFKLHTAARTVLRATMREWRAEKVSEATVRNTLAEIAEGASEPVIVPAAPILLQAIAGESSLDGSYIVVAGTDPGEMSEIIIGDEVASTIGSVSRKLTPSWMIIGHLSTGQIADCYPTWSPGRWD